MRRSRPDDEFLMVNYGKSGVSKESQKGGGGTHIVDGTAAPSCRMSADDRDSSRFSTFKQGDVRA